MSKIWEALKKAESERQVVLAAEAGAHAEAGLLTAEQRAAIQALLAHPTLADAGAACGVSEHTLQVWLKLPAFAVAFVQASRRKRRGDRHARSSSHARSGR